MLPPLENARPTEMAGLAITEDVPGGAAAAGIAAAGAVAPQPLADNRATEVPVPPVVSGGLRLSRIGRVIAAGSVVLLIATS